MKVQRVKRKRGEGGKGHEEKELLCWLNRLKEKNVTSSMLGGGKAKYLDKVVVGENWCWNAKHTTLSF